MHTGNGTTKPEVNTAQPTGQARLRGWASQALWAPLTRASLFLTSARPIWDGPQHGITSSAVSILNKSTKVEE